MEFILNRPMPASECEQVFSRCLCGCEACDAVLRLMRGLSRLGVCAFDAVLINLSQAGPIGVIVEQCACGEGASDQSTACFFRCRVRLQICLGFCVHECELWGRGIGGTAAREGLKKVSDVFRELLLIGFDG